MYEKLFLIFIVIFIQKEINGKCILVLMLLTFTLVIKRIDLPYLTEKLNNYDYLVSFSLIIIFLLLYLSNIFDAIGFRISVSIFIILANIWIYFTGCKRIIMFLFHDIIISDSKSKESKIKILLKSIFQSKLLFI